MKKPTAWVLTAEDDVSIQAVFYRIHFKMEDNMELLNLSEELKNNANNEMNDDELENVAGGIGGKGKLHTQILFCPKCRSTKVSKISSKVYLCRECSHQFSR